MPKKVCKICSLELSSKIINTQGGGQAVAREFCARCYPLYYLVILGLMTMERAILEGKRIRRALESHKGKQGVCN
jgi:hypothetical protein